VLYVLCNSLSDFADISFRTALPSSLCVYRSLERPLEFFIIFFIPMDIIPYFYLLQTIEEIHSMDRFRILAKRVDGDQVGMVLRSKLSELCNQTGIATFIMP
jgi:hypothetical protein